MESIEAVVLCGGWGRRMGYAMQGYPCKSLIPILGRPSLAYVLEALKKIQCSNCILCIDRDALHDDVTRVGLDSDMPFTVLRDSAGGPTSVALEAAREVRSSRFLMLHGHQIVYPDLLAQMIAQAHEFVVTVYGESSEGVRKVATLNEGGYCVRVRRGSSSEPARECEVYLEKPYLLSTQPMASCVLSDQHGDPGSPVDADLRPHTVLRYLRSIYTIAATFRHEYHYEHELAQVTCVAATFCERYSERR